MSTRLGLYTPVTNPYLTSSLEWAEEIADHYLSVTNVIATVTQPANQADTTPVVLSSTPWSSVKCVITLVKVLSYAILIFPVIALVLKLHRKLSHRYVIATPTPPIPQAPIGVQNPPIIIDDDTPDDPSTRPDISQAEALRSKRMLEHCTIAEVLNLHRNALFAKNPNSYCFIERTSLEENCNQPFTLHFRRNTPTHLRVARPATGRLALSIHSATHMHFTGLFADFAERKIVYYDSFGTKMNRATRALINKVRATVFDTRPVEIICINKRHQYDGYNCGRYVIHFLNAMMSSSNIQQTIARLQGSSLNERSLFHHVRKWIQNYNIL